MAKKQRLTNIRWKEIIASYIVVFILFSALTILPNLTNPEVLTGVRIVVQLVTILLLLSALALYIYFADASSMESTRKTWAMFTTMILAFVIIQLSKLWEYAIQLVPFALCALILSLIVSGKCGFFANFIIIMLCFMQDINWRTGATLNSENFFYLLFGGVIEAVFVSFVLGKQYRRSRYLAVGLALSVISVVTATISYLMFKDAWSWAEYGIRVACAFGSGLIAVMLMFLLVPLLEKIFNVSTVFRFSEIATSDSALMRKLFEKAPGTYNHCLTVATYVEACAVAIGQSAVMARAAAYYHDIGKLKNPGYFAENQFSGINPHDSMTPEASVNMIKLHTVNGLAIAKEYGLPKEVQTAIIEHHGTMPIKYFYLKAQKYTDGVLPYDGYCYDGPKPSNKISAILMICDSCEAALRASGNRDNVEKIVDGIVAERLAFDQFSNCDISMKEIDIIKSTIITTFTGIRHKRVSYPDVRLKGDV
ncbi:MAG: HDIG domain-containing protein [Clostridiales bacterium]|nr:HDIG domain-containing protein [Clostridiales bacterium]